MRATLLVLFVAGCASAPPPPPPEPVAPPEPTFAIQLHRPARIGEIRTQRTSMTATESLVVKSEETVLQQRAEEKHVVFAGTEKILDINEDGTATKSEYVIEEAFVESNADRTELVPAGAVLVVTRGVESPFALDDGELTPEAEKLLGMLLSTSAPKRTDDDVFGSETPQPVGGRWPIRAEIAARDLTESGLAVDATALTGETELAGLETVGAVECLQIVARMTADNLTPPGLQSGDTVEKARVEATFAGTFPTDPSKRRLGDSSEMTAEVTILRTVSGRPVRTELLMKRTLLTTWAPGA
jgi:hypothetical protein